MTKTTTYELTLVLFSALALAGCGTDPYAGESPSAGTGGATTGTGGAPTGTGGAMSGAGGTMLGTGGAMFGAGGTMPGTGGAMPGTGGTITGPDAGADSPDAPSGAPTIDYIISVSPQRLVDLVFMIDNSPSMAPKQQKLKDNFPRLIAALKDPNDGTLPDLRVAILDSDLGTGGAYSSGSCGPKTLPDGTVSVYGDMGRFQMIGASACGVTSSDATYLETTGNTGINFSGDINTVFACLAGNLGTLGCGEEHQLQAFEFAFLVGGLGDVNNQQHQMLRGNANLGLVFLTDEDDCSAAPNDAMFGNKPELYGESASLRCYTRSHTCNGMNLADPPPGYPTTAAFSTALTSCSARVGDSCTNGEDVSSPTTCNPLRDVKVMADEIKALKVDPDNQLFVAGIFGWPLSGTDPSTAQYKIGVVPNPNTADTAHPSIYDTWPICYDPNHQPEAATADKTTGFDPAAAGFGATPGLRLSAFVDQFGANGQKFSICETDFSASMSQVGSSIARKLENLCINDKLWLDPDTGKPSCQVAYRRPVIDPNNPSVVTYALDPVGMAECDTSSMPVSGVVPETCWFLGTDTTMCPVNGQKVMVARSAADIQQYGQQLPLGTQLDMQCRICSTSPSAVQVEGCNY